MWDCRNHSLNDDVKQVTYGYLIVKNRAQRVVVGRNKNGRNLWSQAQSHYYNIFPEADRCFKLNSYA